MGSVTLAQKYRSSTYYEVFFSYNAQLTSHSSSFRDYLCLGKTFVYSLTYKPVVARLLYSADSRLYRRALIMAFLCTYRLCNCS